MALTIATPKPQKSDDVFGGLRVRIRTVTFDNSYPTGGESMTAADLGLSEILFVDFSVDHSPAYQLAYDYVNSKILVFGVQQDADAAVTDPFDEEDNGADLSTLQVRILVLGV